MVTLTEPTSSGLHSLVDAVQQELFGADDTVCLERSKLVTEAHQRFGNLPAPIMRARTLGHLLEHMTVDVRSNPVLGGNTSTRPRAWMLMPEFDLKPMGQAIFEHDFITRDWLDDKVPVEIRDYWQGRKVGQTPGGAGGIGHYSLDLRKVVDLGLEGVMTEIHSAMTGDDCPENTYRQAMLLACESVARWSERIAAAADIAAGRSEDPARRAAHSRVAAACRQVPLKPARDYFEGLQSILIVYLAAVIEGQGCSFSIGLPDRALARFADEAAEHPERCTECTRAFLLGLCANSYHGRVSKTQALTLGGVDHGGRDCCSEVTLRFLDAFEQTPVADPHAFFRWHRNVSESAWAKVVRLLSRGRSMPLLVNDEEVAPGLEDLGVTSEDAWNYCIIGCNELGIPGKATGTAWSHGTNVVDIEIIDHCLRRDPSAFGSPDDVLTAYSHEIVANLRKGLRSRRERNDQLVRTVPLPLSSAFSDGPAREGRDYLHALPYRDLVCSFVRGTTNAINALAALDEIVFRGGEMTLAEMLTKLDAEDPGLVDRIAGVAKWGNDDDRADQWAHRLHEAREAAYRKVESDNPGLRLLTCHVIRSLHHLSGALLGPTPDGRGASAALADSIGAHCGTSAEGPTALLNSVLKLDARRWYRGIYNLNLTLSGNQASPAVLRPLIEAFFLDGGQELQINVLSLDKLLAARERPEDFQDLVVRIAGLNARFVELSRLEQDEIIRRAEATA